MTRIGHISLLRFKNHADVSYAFPARITGITGKNGSGKTNLLDALYYLCLARSYFAGTDAALVRYGEQGFRLSGVMEKPGEAPLTVTCILRENGSKELQVGEELCKKLSAYIGRFACVMIAPDDIEIVNSTGGTPRRRFLDAILCQTQPVYLNTLQQYNKLLLQRNTLLRQPPPADESLLDVYDSQLSILGTAIYTERKKLTARLEPRVMDFYQELAGSEDGIALQYISQLAETGFHSLLQRYRPRDIAAQRTLCGTHKDDWEFSMQGKPLRQTASQGQKKSLLLALKLAELQALKDHFGEAPVLLLDDMFERLDPERVARLLQWITGPGCGQVFITDTNEAQLKQHLENYKADFSILRLGV